MKKTVVVTMLCTLGLCVLLAGCGSQTQSSVSSSVTDASSTSSSSDTSSSATSQAGTKVSLPDNSILSSFNDDGSRWLVRDIQNGKVPQSCTVLYDKENALPIVTATDENEVKELFDLVSNICVRDNNDKGDTAATDGYHFVTFKRQDGSSVGFRFEGEGNLAFRDANYAVDGDGALWDKVRELQANADGTDHIHDIVIVSDEDNLVLDCPTTAIAGETVRLEVNVPLDVQLVVRMNGELVDSHGMYHEFAMPDRPAEIEVYTESYPDGGGS